jgi:hypothetical protein
MRRNDEPPGNEEWKYREDQKEKYAGCLELWLGMHWRTAQLNLPDSRLLSQHCPRATQKQVTFVHYSLAGQDTRVVAADFIGHGFDASRVATHVHRMLHDFRKLRNSSHLLEALMTNSPYTARSEYYFGGKLNLVGSP